MMKIFVIDDDQLFTRKLQFQLEATGFHEVHVFSRSERAAGQLSAIQPDVVFLDHYLEGIPGTEIIPVILEKVPSCSIVSMSSQADIKIMEQAIRTGAYKYLKKDECFSENVTQLMKELSTISTEDSLVNKLGKLFQKNKKRDTPLIFILDDDEVLTFMINYKLDIQRNFNVETFLDGMNAMKNLDRKPDILILDYNLKKMKGSVVLEEFKRKSPETKIIIISSQQEIDVALKLIEMGADDYVVKGEDFIEKLKMVLEKSFT